MRPVQVFSMPNDRILERIKGIKEGRKKTYRVRQAFRKGGAAQLSYSLRVKLQESVTFTRGFLDPGLLDSQPGSTVYKTLWHWYQRAGHFLSTLFPSELLWRYDLSKDCSRNSCLRNKESTRSKLSALCRNSLYLQSKNRTDGKRVASTAQQGLWHRAATATKIWSKDRKRQCS